MKSLNYYSNLSAVAAGEHVADFQLAPDLSRVNLLAFVSEHRAAPQSR
jgi:hypothetical protein